MATVASNEIVTASSSKQRGDTPVKEKRGKAIAAMGLVRKQGEQYIVESPSLRNGTTCYLRRESDNSISCTCKDYSDNKSEDTSYRCEHKIAVIEAVGIKNVKEIPDDNLDEQFLDKISDYKEKENMTAPKQANNQEATKSQPSIEVNIVPSADWLANLKKPVDPHLVKQREGWRDRNGNTHYVDYVEWHVVADILDQYAPVWNHEVKSISQIGDVFVVVVELDLYGVKRQGIGTGAADSELGIKKAEHDALKRAAVKFGVARDLYKKETEVIENGGSYNTGGQSGGGFADNPIAKSLSELVTAKQLGMIRAIAREIGIEEDDECNAQMKCVTDQLSKKAASAFIQHLQELQKQGDGQPKKWERS